MFLSTKWHRLKSSISAKIYPNILKYLNYLSDRCSSLIADLSERLGHFSDTLPLALKWSVIIACFVSVVMGSLGWYLISQQTDSFRKQSELLGQVVADQLSGAASEPLLAGDSLTLKVLVSQQKKHELISGMEIYDLKGKLQASAGVSAVANIKEIIAAPSSRQEPDWQVNEIESVSFFSPIRFNKVNTGLVVVSMDRRPLEQHLETLTSALLTTTFGLVLVGILLAFPLAFQLAKPIDNLMKVGEALDSEHSAVEFSGNVRKDAIGRISSTFSRMGKHLDKKKRVETAFSRHLSPSIAREVLDKPEGSALGGTLIEGSVLFCDIVGFTEMSENMSPRDVGDLINQYFSYFSYAAQSCHGTVDKFIGDCIMILFGVPEVDESHGLNALTCAVMIQDIAKRINDRREKEGLGIVEFRLGIHSGEMLAGNLGSEERMQYTVVGDTVNLAARMCSHCKPGEVLVSESVVNHASVTTAVHAFAMEPISVKGRRQTVVPYSIRLQNFVDDLKIRRELEKILPRERM